MRRQIQEELRQQELNAELNEFLAEELTAYNDRDTQLVRERLDEIVDSLGDSAEEVDRLLFGGSVAKHTYVDGLSDVDALVVLNQPDASPRELVERFAQSLLSRLVGSDVLDISTGKLAVTVTYRDGSQVQLLPAVERGGRTSIASEDGSSWRHIRPHKFAEKLTEVNQSNGNAVVPTIKLAKAVIAGLPENNRLSGYHVEAIAVDAFKEYTGRRDRVSMLQHLIGHAADAVLRPTGDITGQSVHIDGNLGAANSSARQSTSASLRQLENRIRNAASLDDYRRLLDG
jgi:hypothetical protein